MITKRAQERSTRSKIWEAVNLKGKALEGLHSEIGETMERMRDVDAKIREKATDVKLLIRTAKSSVRTRDYLMAASNFAEFHDRCRFIANELEKFVRGVDIKHYKYLLDNFKDPHKSKLFEYDPEKKLEAQVYEFEQMSKEGGIGDIARHVVDYVGDTAHNMFTGDGNTRKMLEKRFSTDFIKKLKLNTENMLKDSTKMLHYLLSSFDALESGVSRRNVSHYVSQANVFLKRYADFHAAFILYYKDVITPLKNEQQRMFDEKNKQNQDAANKQIQDEENRKAQEQETYEQSIIEDAKKQEENVDKYKHFIGKTQPKYTEPTFDEWKKWRQENEKQPEEALDELTKLRGPEDYNPKGALDKLEKMRGTEAANNFVNRLVSLADANDNSGFIASVFDYSATTKNKNISDQLLRLANIMVQDKTAGIFDMFKKKENKPEPRPIVEPPIDPSKYRIKSLDLEDGQLDQPLSDIPSLNEIPLAKIRATLESSRHITSTIIKRLSHLTGIDDLSKYAKDIDTKLMPELRQAVHNGWVLSVGPVFDDHNPKDKYLEMYIRLNLGNVNQDLDGIAKMRVSCRVSAEHGAITIRGIQKNFDIDVPRGVIENIKNEEGEEDFGPRSDNGGLDYDIDVE